MEQEPPACDTVCDFLVIELLELADIIKEDPETIQSWFYKQGAFRGNYFQLDNSPAHNALDKYFQLLEVAEHIKKLTEIVGSENEVIVILTRSRKKLGGKSFAEIATSTPNPLPSDNGFQEMLEKLRAWCKKKGIALPTGLLED